MDLSDAMNLFAVRDAVLRSALADVRVPLPYDFGTFLDREDLAQIVKSYERHHVEARHTIQEGLHIFLHRRLPRGDLALFKKVGDLDDAIRIAATFRLLNIQFSGVRFSSAQSSGDTKPMPRSNLRSFPLWARHDDFRGVPVERKRFPLGDAFAAEDWFGLRPLSQKAGDVRCLRVLARFASLLPYCDVLAIATSQHSA